ESIAPAAILNPISPRILGFSHHLPMPQQPKAYFFVAEKKIGGDGEMRAQDDLLMHRVDAMADRLMRRGERDRLAFPVYFAARADMDAGQQLDQRRFTGAVFADNRVDFALLKDKIDAL